MHSTISSTITYNNFSYEINYRQDNLFLSGSIFPFSRFRFIINYLCFKSSNPGTAREISFFISLKYFLQRKSANDGLRRFLKKGSR